MEKEMNNLATLVFEDVNSEYGWGKYGDFKVLIHKKDGYINVTKLCQVGGKELKNWTANKMSNLLVEELSSAVGIPAAGLFVQVIGGHNTDIRGTYAHPDLVPHVASWVSPKFAITVSRIINDYFVREHKLEIAKLNRELGIKQNTIEDLVVEVRNQTSVIDKQTSEIEMLRVEMGLMSDKLDVANENTVEVLGKLGAVSERQVPLDRIPASKRECLWVLHTPNTSMPYQVLRAQKSMCESILAKKQKEQSGVRVICAFDTHPNPREEFICFRRRAVGMIFCKSNKFSLLRNATEQQVIDLLEQVHQEKMKEYEDSLRVSSEDERDDEEEREQEVYTYNSSNLLQRQLTELKEMARGLSKTKGIKGWSKLKKTELVNWILENMEA